MWNHNRFGHSSQFLAGPIHSEVEKKYYEKNVQNLKQYKKYQQNAKKLSKYFNDLKNFLRNFQNGTNIFSAAQYQLLSGVFEDIRNKQGLPSSDIFRHKQGGKQHYFQQQLADLQITLKSIVQKESFNEDSIKQYKGRIIIGQDKTEINFPVEQIMKDTTQKFLKQIGIKTKRYYSEQSKKDKNQSALIGFQRKEPKIDLRTDSVIVDQQIEMQYSNIADFAKLYSQSAISAKNYTQFVYNAPWRESGFSIGNTQLFRVIADFIPTLSLGLTREQEISFQYAIFKRYHGMIKKSVTADSSIETHFMHIQNIYELMGVGQNYYKNGQLNQLNSFLKQGVEYLITNISDSDYIQVFSTRSILYERYQKMLAENRSESFFNHFTPI